MSVDRTGVGPGDRFKSGAWSTKSMSGTSLLRSTRLQFAIADSQTWLDLLDDGADSG
jgi:hypothetical protein